MSTVVGWFCRREGLQDCERQVFRRRGAVLVTAGIRAAAANVGCDGGREDGRAEGVGGYQGGMSRSSPPPETSESHRRTCCVQAGLGILLLRTKCVPCRLAASAVCLRASCGRGSAAPEGLELWWWGVALSCEWKHPCLPRFATGLLPCLACLATAPGCSSQVGSGSNAA